MVRQAADELPSLDSFTIKPNGASIQVRVYAENPAKDFQPSSGILTAAEFSTAARVETWVERGIEVSAFYDPMLAKIIVHGPDRDTTIAKLLSVLDDTSLQGIETNLAYLKQILHSAVFCSGQPYTQFLDGFHYQPHSIDVLNAGVQTTIQDYPGRIGYWNVGVPPSGPMDSLAFRLASARSTILKIALDWKLRWQARRCALIVTASSQSVARPLTCFWTVNHYPNGNLTSSKPVRYCNLAKSSNQAAGFTWPCEEGFRYLII